MWKLRLVLMVALVLPWGGASLAQEDIMDGSIGGPDVEGEAVGVGDEPVGGYDVGGEAVGVGDGPAGGEDVGGEPIGEEDEPIGGEPLY
jgi:hypothetical protein